MMLMMTNENNTMMLLFLLWIFTRVVHATRITDLPNAALSHIISLTNDEDAARLLAVGRSNLMDDHQVASISARLAASRARLLNEAQQARDPYGQAFLAGRPLGFYRFLQRHGVRASFHDFETIVRSDRRPENTELCIRELLQAGLDPNQVVEDNLTPLLLATQRNHVPAIKALLSSATIMVNLGKNLNMEYWRPLDWAVGANHIDAAEVLIGERRTKVSGFGGNATILGKIIHMDRKEIFQMILERPDLDVNEREMVHESRVPLHIAAQQQDPSYAQALLDHPNIDVSISTRRKIHPLHVAVDAHLGDNQMLTLETIASHGKIKEFGLDPANFLGNTPLHMVSDSAFPGVACRILLKHGANQNVFNLANETPAYRAISRDSTDTIIALAEVPTTRFFPADIELARSRGLSVVQLMENHEYQRSLFYQAMKLVRIW